MGLGYTYGMEYTDYIIYKFIALVALVFVVNVIYAAVTGRTIEQERFDIPPERRDSSDLEVQSRDGHPK